MTTSMDNTIDELIRRIKEDRAVSDFVFLSAYAPRERPNPIGKYVVTVENTGVGIKHAFIGSRVAEGERGALYECTVRLRTYAPENTSGSALLRATSLLADAADRADTDRCVQDMHLFGIVYDAVTRTVYRDLTITLACVLSEEVCDD